jgi:formaldehyde-activating enzyme involved in methanogenesis
MTPQTITTPDAQVSVHVKDYVIFVTIQTAQATQVVRLLADEAIDLYAALDVAIDRAREAEPQPEPEDTKAYRWLGASEADRGL